MCHHQVQRMLSQKHTDNQEKGKKKQQESIHSAALEKATVQVSLREGMLGLRSCEENAFI